MKIGERLLNVLFGRPRIGETESNLVPRDEYERGKLKQDLRRMRVEEEARLWANS